MSKGRRHALRVLVPAILAVALLLAGCSYGTTQPATEITASSATLNGYVTAGDSSESTYWFEYGTAPAYPDRPTPGHVQTPSRTVQIGDGQRAVQEAISGLEPDTVYHFRLCARDTEGQSDAGCNDPQQFRTEPGEPSELAISAQPELYPGFDPATSDYVTRCTSEPVAVDVAAPADTEVSVDGQPGQSGRFTEAVQLSPGQRFDFSTTTGGTSSTFHVRCLPGSFPNWTYSRTGVPSQAWTLTSVVIGITESQYVAFFDGAGVPVWWYHPDGVLPIDAKLLSDDTVAFGEWSLSGFSANPALKYQIRRLDGSLVRTLQTVGTPTDFHELQEAGNGNFLLVSYRPRDHVDLSAFGKPSDATVLDAEIQEVTPAGELVWSWNSKDHIGLAETGRWWNGMAPNRLPDGRDAYDYAHINAVEPDGNGLLVSLRHTDAIYRISRSGGGVEWKLGGSTTGASLAVSGDPLSYNLGGQHDVRRLADGTVTVYDNGTGLGRPPRAVRFRINASAKTAALEESLSDSQIPTSGCCGSARKLDSNGWLLAWGGQPVIAEYAADKSRIFRLQFTDTAAVVYRAFPVPGGRISADQLRQAMDGRFPR